MEKQRRGGEEDLSVCSHRDQQGEGLLATVVTGRITSSAMLRRALLW